MNATVTGSILGSESTVRLRPADRWPCQRWSTALWRHIPRFNTIVGQHLGTQGRLSGSIVASVAARRPRAMLHSRNLVSMCRFTTVGLARGSDLHTTGTGATPSQSSTWRRDQPGFARGVTSTRPLAWPARSSRRSTRVLCSDAVLISRHGDAQRRLPSPTKGQSIRGRNA